VTSNRNILYYNNNYISLPSDDQRQCETDGLDAVVGLLLVPLRHIFIVNGYYDVTPLQMPVRWTPIEHLHSDDSKRQSYTVLLWQRGDDIIKTTTTLMEINV